MDLDSAADELYGLPPSQFTARRSALAGEARGSGDRSLAQAIGALRRPTVSAWLTNQLVREAGEPLRDLLGIGDALRAAQARLAGDELRDLAQRARAAVERLVGEAAAVGPRCGQAVSPPVLAEVEATLQAALADRELADQVLAGRLTAGLTHTGFGPPPETPGRPAVKASPPHGRAEAAARRAHERLQERRAEHERATARHEAASQRVRRLEAELSAARSEAAAAERALREAQRRLERIRGATGAR